VFRARRIATAVGLAVAAVLTVASSPAIASSTVAGTASSHQKAWTCDSGYLCLYQNEGGTGHRCQYKLSHADIHAGNYPCRLNGKNMVVKSAYNRSGAKFDLYPKVNYKGGVTALRNGGKVENIADGVRSIKKVG
jgi:hypothetical protein